MEPNQINQNPDMSTMNTVGTTAQSPAPKKSSTGLMVSTIIIIILIALGVWYFSSQTTQPETTTVPEGQDATQELENIERESAQDDFSAIETDFGTEVNTAVQ